MSRLIDADALKDKVKLILNGNTRMKAYAIYAEIETAPTVDAVPVVHGEWIIDGMNEYELSYGCIGYEPIYRCSNCGTTTESYLRTEKPIMPEDADFPKYCQYCGAKMDGKEFEEPTINPCRGCIDYDGFGGCKSNGGCGMEKDDG